MQLQRSPYGLQDIRSVPKNSIFFARGTRYAREDRVRDVSWSVEGNETYLSGFVDGSGQSVYEQHILIPQDPRKIHGSCTCPIGYNCKHVVALLLRGMSHFESLKPHKSIGVSVELSDWMKTIDNLQKAPKDKNAYPATIRNRLIYVLDEVISHIGKADFVANIFTVPLLKNGNFSTTRPNPYSISSFNPRNHARYIRPIDVDIIKAINHGEAPDIYSSWQTVRLGGEGGYEILKKILSTNRCYWKGIHGQLLSWGEEIEGSLSWKPSSDGKQTPTLRILSNRNLTILPLSPPCYIDPINGEVGIIETNVSNDLSLAFLKAPAVSPQQVALFSQEMTKRFSDIDLPSPDVLKEESRKGGKPTPCLKLFMGRAHEIGTNNWYGMSPVEVPMARLSFAYGNHRVDWEYNSSNVRTSTFVEEGALITLKRHQTAEKTHLKQLKGFSSSESDEFYDHVDAPDNTLIYWHEGEEAERNYACLELIQSLRGRGWRIDTKEFPFQVETISDFVFDIEDNSGEDWFECDLSTIIDGKRVNLVPVFVNFLKQLSTSDMSEFDAWLKGKETLMLPSEKNRFIAVPAKKVAPFLRFLLGLLQAEELSIDRIKLPRYRSAELIALEEETADIKWQGGKVLRELGRKLRDFSTIQEVPLPGSFSGVLRPYQQDGLNWLQFLREYQLNGILADDMGLGKTIQALVHICLEKESGRLTKPCLIVAPTSLIPNWVQETHTFAPSLNILPLHGSQRKGQFSKIKHHDIVLTSYPLLVRDKEFYQEQEFHLAILDEAQVIKNPRAQVSQVARSLQATHRLCMTGTPMENHLGELWSIMSFLMPGLLSTEKRFRSIFRTPIEKNADQDRHQLLSQRVKPFMLRRTKKAVIKELPDKQVSVVKIPLFPEQKALYETVRLSVDKKVREAIAAKGLGRTHILVLEALLKLRQVCCDPRLVKGAKVEQDHSSAKLERLMEMLVEMIEEGRRILLFSQFTSMLALIEERLNELKIKYVKLTGSTKDRKTPVDQFQKGKTPIFLISLKAGGSGLNLTAADTVIHYDPWWNPAVEDQATDRAHRIGQSKKVFVYKLVSEGTVEEKILTLQAKKKALTDGILEKHSGQKSSFDANDLKMLLEPLPV